MTSAKHTPTPWKWCGCGKCGYVTNDAMTSEVAYIVAVPAPAEGGPDNVEHPYWCSPAYDPEVRNANAAFIVRACNSFNALHEAADEALNVLIGCVVSAGGCDDAKHIANAKAKLRIALKMAEESNASR